MPGNALTFILKLQDMLTPGMKHAAVISESTSAKIKSQFTGIEYSGKKLGASVNDLKYRLQEVNKIRMGTHIKKEFDSATASAKILERQLNKLENKGRGERSGFGIGSLIKGNLATLGLMAAGRAITGGLGSIVSASVIEEQNKVGLKTFLGEAGANAAYANIKKDAAATPFDTQSLLMTNRALISAGASAKDARQDTLNLANAVSAVGGGNDVLSRMAANMQQIKTVGKATAMDVRQFGMAGINIYKILADSTGKSINQVKEMDVTYAMLSKALQKASEKGGMYFGAMKAQSETVGGKWSTFLDNLKNTAADIGTALQPLFHWFLNMGISITDNFSKIMPYIQPVIDVINRIPAIISSLTDGTSEWAGYFDLIKGFAFKLWDTIKSIWGNVMNVVEGVIKWIGKSEMVKDIFKMIGGFASGILDFVSEIFKVIQWMWDHLLGPMLDKIETVYEKLKKVFTWDMEAFTVNLSPELQKALKEKGIFQDVPGQSKSANVLTMPGDTVNPKSLNPTNTKSAAGGIDTDLGKTKSDSINSGGQRSIVINIAKQIEKLEVHVMDAKEGVNEIEGMVRDAMRRVVYSMNGVAS